MIIELGVGLIALGALGYTIHWQMKRMKLVRERMKLVRAHEKQMERLKSLKKEFEREN